MFEITTRESIEEQQILIPFFKEALKERLEWFLEPFNADTLKSVEGIRLFAMESEIELEGLIIIKDNLNDNIEYVERSFVYIQDEEGEVYSHEGFLHIVFYEQDTDQSKEYIIAESILSDITRSIFNPHILNVYNEDWEKRYHEKI